MFVPLSLKASVELKPPMHLATAASAWAAVTLIGGTTAPRAGLTL